MFRKFLTILAAFSLIPFLVNTQVGAQDIVPKQKTVACISPAMFKAGVEGEGYKPIAVELDASGFVKMVMINKEGHVATVHVFPDGSACLIEVMDNAEIDKFIMDYLHGKKQDL